MNYPRSASSQVLLPLWAPASTEMLIDPNLANTLRFARTFALIYMTFFFRNAFIRNIQSVGTPFAYLSWSRTSS